MQDIRIYLPHYFPLRSNSKSNVPWINDPGPAEFPTEHAFVSSPPAGSKGPDDITLLAIPGLDGGAALIWTAFQNGIMPNGTAGHSGGPTLCTVAGYDPSTGTLVENVSVAGKCDGLIADPARGRLIATVNEDDYSAFNLIEPATRTVIRFMYSPDPAVSGERRNR